MLHLVDAEDPIVADLLLGTIELVLQCGGWVDPQVRFVERAGQLSVHHRDLDCTQTRPLLRIPREAFVRVDAVTWDHSIDRLEITELPDDIGDAELPMLYLQTALHNQSDKLAWLRRTHPAIADLPDDLVASVRAIEPGFRNTVLSATDLLFSNRCFRVAMDERAAPQRVLIPLLDLLNHRHGGATADWDGQMFSVLPSTAPGSTECLLDYGLQRDALEMALVYGFVDDAVTWVHSAPMDLQIDGVGRVIVTRDHRGPDGSIQPVRIEHASHATRINRLTFDACDDLVDELIASSRWSRDQAHAVSQRLRHENRRILSTLRDQTQSEARHASTSLINQAAEHSLALL